MIWANPEPGFDAWLNNALEPIAAFVADIIFVEVNIFGTPLPIIVLWLVAAGFFFTLYFGFINLRGLPHAIRLIRSGSKKEKQEGEISHFQALTTAVSGTVGIGNIGGVAIVISTGGPGAIFWLLVAGFVGMSTKMAECTAAVLYRKINPDGTVSGGPMYYLEKGITERLNWPRFGRAMGIFYAAAIVVGCLGIGNMFQSNQAFEQFVFMTGGSDAYFADKGWLFGILIAASVALVILGGLKAIAKVTSRLVPFMAVTYVIGCLVVIAMNFDKVPWAFSAIFSQAFNPEAMQGGILGVMILGFQRAVFSNEAGIGSSAIAHAAVKTSQPATEGFIGILEPFIDTIIICLLSSLVILTGLDYEAVSGSGLQGIEMTSRAFAGSISWSTGPLSFIAILFAFSTMIAWSYYGLKGWTYLFGEGKAKENIFKFVFCVFGAIGCTVQLGPLLQFSDAMVFLVAFPNLLGLYLLAPRLKREINGYFERTKS